MPRFLHALPCLLAAGLAFEATATGACDLPPRYGVGPSAAAIVRTACQEHRAWLQPFVESDGRLASLAITEAEDALLDHGPATAWQRVAVYWRESATLAAMGGTPGAASCTAPPGDRATDNDCRAFVLDNPWSAAFISWVMRQAQLPGFIGSARHIDYIARAWRQPATSPYLYEDPFAGKPEPGDMLCFLREGEPATGATRLRAALSGNGPLPSRSHCEIVVAANPGGDRTLYLVSGNVLNTVLMRKLPLDRTGRLEAGRILPGQVAAPEQAGPEATPGGDASPAPQSFAGPEYTLSAGCSPGNPQACDFNRRDWAVLLKLKPQAALDALRPRGTAGAGAPSAPAPAATAPAPDAAPTP